MAHKFMIPRGQLLGAFFLPPGTTIDDTSGVYKVTLCPLNTGLIGYAFPTFFPGKDAIPANQQSYDLLRTKYLNRDIITHDDAKAGITRNYDPGEFSVASPPYPIVNQFGVVVGFQNSPLTTAYGDHI